ncbi:NCS1 family nucleobase:cation symporter-1 [Salinicola salarius]|uniref:NCS1 family nucleobase:cation symporter-1 n=1 Tax=Salinicola salarius TaxID=430457 RepID=UPI000B3FA7C5|nr:NCS1 family nucleobase:cation symporter-1 [Salinicola salarius]
MPQQPHHSPHQYSDRLYNADLAPTRQNWNWYNILAFWLSDVHSVGGYVVAASLFALGLAGWQVLISLLIGICIVQIFANLMAKPSQKAAVPFPVICRLSFGVLGANIPAMIRGLIAVVWYGIQTYLASNALTIVILRLFPGMESLAGPSFLGLSYLGWISFMLLWSLQAIVFWRGMDSIRRFIDWSGPAVYLVMFALAAWLVWQAGWANISFTLSDIQLSPGEQLWQMVIAAAIVAGYFAGPTLNFGDFTRYARTFDDVKRGNFWGLPVNFLVFSATTVMMVSATLPVFGEMIDDPIETVSRLDNTFVAVLGAATFVTTTIGINIVANFVAPAFDFSNMAPSKISFRTGGFIAAVGSIFLTPWNLFSNPEIIHYTVDLLAAAIGPLYGILIMDYYRIRRGEIDVDALFSVDPNGPYWYRNGFNPAAVKAVVAASLIGIVINFLPLGDLGHFSVFIGGALGATFYAMAMRRASVAAAIAS